MKVLVIDDEPLNVEILQQHLTEEGYDVAVAGNGAEGLAALESNHDISVILLDRCMHGMNGLEFMAKLKNNKKYLNIPVVMQTAIADNDSVIEGINAGAYYYLTKPYKKDLLISIVKSAISDASYKKQIIDEVRKSHKMLGLLNSAWFELKTMDEAQNLAYFIAGSFPDPEKVVLGLSELMLNAVEHGNLGISYHEKSKLMMKNALHDEILRRESLPENKNKKVQVLFEKNKLHTKVTIKDSGNGFKWKDFIEMSPERATDPNGRGIILARTLSFDSIEYNDKGNEVCCKVKL